MDYTDSEQGQHELLRAQHEEELLKRSVRETSVNACDAVFDLLDALPAVDGDTAGKIAKKVQDLIERELSDFLRLPHPPQTPQLRLPPEGTSFGCRNKDGSMWLKCAPEPERKPGIAVCEHPGNWVNPAFYRLVAVFEKEEDRNFVLELHKAYVTSSDVAVPAASEKRSP